MKISSIESTIFFIFMGVTFGFFGNADCWMQSPLFDLIALRLYRDVKFMYERPAQMNADSVFGLTLAQVHVSAVLKHQKSLLLGAKNRWILEETLKLCKSAQNDGKQMVATSGYERMIRPEIWNKTILWKRGELQKKSTKNFKVSRKNVTRLLYQGTPSMMESMSCFMNLLKQDENFHCRISDDCADMSMRNDSSRGYPLTHRLLYIQLANSFGCQEHPQIRFTELKKHLCSEIRRDLIDLEIANFPLLSKDLAMEQISLCGFEGYLEFANEHFAKLIASWVTPQGCYSAFGSYPMGIRHRRKRSTFLMDYGCDNHASGVAAASLSLLIRSAVET